MRAKPWQKQALANLNAAFGEGKNGPRHRAALLQLPTGLGKCLVAIRLFKALAHSYHGLPLLIVLPRDFKHFNHIPMGWRIALCRELIGSTLGPTWDTVDCPKLPGSRVALTTHRALLHPRGEWREWLRSRRVFVILDEAHRLGRQFKHTAAQAFLNGGAANGLLKWLQRPDRGRPPIGPFVLLVSATPYNPVRFDRLDDIEGTQGSAAIDHDQEENKILIDELKLVQGLLGQCDRAHSKRHLVKRYCEEVSAALTDPGAPIHRSPLVVTPRLTRRLTPRAPDAHGIRLPSADIRRSIQQLVDFHRVWHRESVDANRTIVERLSLASVHCRPGSRNVMGAPYGLMTRRALGKISSQAECDVKLMVLSDLVRAIRRRRGKVVIFCTHVATARAVAAHLRAELDDNGLVHDSTTQSDEAIESFNRGDCDHPAVLVATDRLSESIDLHRDPAARYLIHFELPWSPLRVLQRFGRLWRIKDPRSVRLPTAPHVFHIVHPGSIEEEVLHRLRRRWSYLDTLGLGSVPCDLGLGQRVPKVPREWGPKVGAS